MSNRFCTAGLAALVTGAVGACLPLVVLVLLRGHGVAMLDTYLTFRVWASAELVLAFVAGFALGADRTLVIFGHLCGTERPRNMMVTIGLWSGLMGIPLLTTWMRA